MIKRQDGFSLVEGLVAALLLVVGIGAAVTVFVSSGHAGATAERHQSAVALAQRELEQIRAMDYDQIGLSGATYSDPGEDLPNPASRVDSGWYRPARLAESGGRLKAERLILPDGSHSYAIAPYETVDIESRSGVETAHVYRFITWRDEECPLLDFSDLNLDIPSVGETVSSLVRDLNASLVGNGLMGTAQSSRNALLNLGPVSGQVATRVNQLLALIDEMLEPAERLSANVLAPILNEIVASIQSFTGLDMTFDLCDMDLSSVLRLKTVERALKSLRNPLEKLTAQEINHARSEFSEAVDAAEAAAARQQFCAKPANALTCLLSGLLDGLINTLNSTVNAVTNLFLGNSSDPGVVDRMYVVPRDVDGALRNATGGLVDDLQQLPGFVSETLAGLDAAGTDENTKRVVVAVVLEHGGPGGPRQPIWMSTVITDPRAGLLQP